MSSVARKIGRRDHEASGCGRRIERGSTAEEPLGVPEQRVQRADERLGAGGQNHSATGSHEERIAEEVTQLRE